MTTRGAVVLLYHRVCQLDRDPYGLAVTPEHFQEQCRILSQRGGVIPLEELARSGRGVAITFDDGYADNAGAAREILSAAGLPATFFIASGLRERGDEAWWDRLEQLLLESGFECPWLDLEVDGRPLLLDVRSESARARAQAALSRRLRPMRPHAIDAVLDAIEAQLGIRSVRRQSHRWMTVAELQQLAQAPGVEIGGHTISHPFLSSLDAPEQRREIEGCRHDLEALVGRPVRSFAYPYGAPDAFTDATVQVVREAGYTIACSATGGTVIRDGNPLRTPRNTVGNWEGGQFEAWLDRISLH